MHSVRNENIDIDTYRPGTNHDSRRRSEGSQAETATTALLRNPRGRRIHPASKGKTIDLAGYLKSEVTAGGKAEESDSARAARLRRYP